VPAFPGQQIAAKPTILLCPHFVCLDVAGAATAMEISASSMYVQQKNAAFDQALRAGRSRFKPPKLFTRQDGIKTILRALRDKLPYFMLPDMDSARRMRNSCPSSACRRHADGHGAPGWPPRRRSFPSSPPSCPTTKAGK
jgi:lauroyl/myristoyl acyltransferase